MTVRTFDAVIAGAGIVGAACAVAAARNGLRVLVVEPNLCGGGATAAGMGHLVVMDDSDAQFALTRYSQQRWDELRQDLPDSVEFRRCGTVWVAAEPEELQAVRRKHHFYAARGVASEMLDERTVYECEPHLGPGLAGGLLVPGDSVIYPPCAAEWLLSAARSEGAHCLQDAVVNVQPGAWRLRSGTTVSAPVCILATGVQAVELVPGLPVVPRKGHLVITDRYPELVRHQLIELGYLKSAHGEELESVAFNVQPRATGQLLLGSSRQSGAGSREVELPMLARMIQRALRYMPQLGRLSVVRSWTGLRAATPDSLPLIGPNPDEPALILATGHEGLGITTALGTADLIVAYLLGTPPPIPPEPYLPARFQPAAAPASRH